MRLIDADAVIKILGIRQEEWDTPDERWRPEREFGSVIMNMPTIEAEPVRHGKWTADENLYTQGMAVCSCCKTEYYRDDLYMVGNDGQGELPNYCPNCGADMRGERK